MSTDELKQYHEAAFDAFCKKVIKTVTADFYRKEKRRVHLDFLEDMQQMSSQTSLRYEDQYGLYCRTYYVHDITVDMRGDSIHHAE